MSQAAGATETLAPPVPAAAAQPPALDPAPRLGFGQALMRSVVLDGADADAIAARHADVTIAPDVEGVDLLDWATMPQMRRAGREAARAVIETAPAALRAG